MSQVDVCQFCTRSSVVRCSYRSCWLTWLFILPCVVFRYLSICITKTELWVAVLVRCSLVRAIMSKLVNSEKILYTTHCIYHNMIDETGVTSWCITPGKTTVQNYMEHCIVDKTWLSPTVLKQATQNFWDLFRSSKECRACRVTCYQIIDDVSQETRWDQRGVTSW